MDLHIDNRPQHPEQPIAHYVEADGELLETLIETLSLHAFIHIYNTFVWFEASPAARAWRVRVTHVTHRDFEFELFGNDLLDLLRQAVDEIEAFERKMALARITNRSANDR